MAKYRSRFEQRSRLANLENKRLTRQTYALIAGSLLLLVLLVVVGIPALMKLAIFFGEIRSSGNPVDQADSIPPTVPQLSLPYQATSSATISLSGFAEAGTTIDLYQDNIKSSDTVTDANGQFTFSNLTLTTGTNTFQFLARDQAGNESQKTQAYSIELDTEDPKITIDEPADGKQFFGVTERTVNLKGTIEPGSRLTLNDRVVVVRSDGTFSNRYQLNDGDNQLIFKATDQAGNQSETILNLNFTP